MATYLIPTVTNGRKIVLEYKVEEREVDKRTKFYKKYKQYIVDKDVLNKAIEDLGVKEKGSRLIMKDTEMAFNFGDYF